MDLKSLIAKMDQIEAKLNEADAPAAAPAAAPVDPARAQFDKFKADDAKAAAIEQVKKMTSPQGGANFIDPKDGIIKYADQANASMGGQPQIKEFPFDWFQKGQEKEFFGTLKAAGLEVVPVERKSLFGSFQVAGIKGGAEAVANIGKAPAVDPNSTLEKLKQLMALIEQYAAVKAKVAAARQAASKPGEKRTAGEIKASADLGNFAGESIEFKGAIAKNLVESFGYNFNQPAPEGYYYDTNGQLVEYSMAQFGQDAGDFGRGAWNGLTLGAGDNINAGVKSVFKGTKYKDELGKEISASQAAEKRSPGLYTAGNVAGAIAAPIPGGAAVGAMKGLGTVGRIAAQGALNYGATKGVEYVKDKSDLKTLGGGKGDPKIQQLQKVIGVVPDGVMGPKTKQALIAWQTQNKIPATGVADAATMQAAGLAESGETMNKPQTVAEGIASLRDRLAMIESELPPVEEETNEEYYMGEDGNVYNALGEQLTDEGVLSALGKGIKNIGSAFRAGVADPAGAKALAGAATKTGEKAALKTGAALARNPGKVAAGAAAAGALGAASLGATQGASTTPVKPPAGPAAPAAPAAPATPTAAQPEAEDPELKDLRAKIDALMAELAKDQNPEVQKGLADAKAKWSTVSGAQ